MSKYGIKFLETLIIKNVEINYSNYRIMILFENDINLLLMFAIFNRYRLLKNSYSKIYLIKRNTNFQIKKIRKTKLESNKIDFEDFLEITIADSDSNFQDSGNALMEETKGMEFRFGTDILKNLTISDEIIKINEGLEGLKKKINETNG